MKTIEHIIGSAMLRYPLCEFKVYRNIESFVLEIKCGENYYSVSSQYCSDVNFFESRIDEFCKKLIAEYNKNPAF